MFFESMNACIIVWHSLQPKPLDCFWHMRCRWAHQKRGSDKDYKIFKYEALNGKRGEIHILAIWVLIKDGEKTISKIYESYHVYIRILTQIFN